MTFKYTIYTGDFYNLKLKESDRCGLQELEPLLPECVFEMVHELSLKNAKVKLQLWIDFNLYNIEML